MGISRGTEKDTLAWDGMREIGHFLRIEMSQVIKEQKSTRSTVNSEWGICSLYILKCGSLVWGGGKV